MHIYSVSDPEFRSYGKLLEGYDTAELLAAMQARMDERKYDMMLFLITDMLKEGSQLLFLGAPDVIAQAFNVRPDAHRAFLPGILSRKKQVIPALSVFWG